MDPCQGLTSPPKPAEPPLDLITPSHVWASLTLNQQNCLLQTVVRICREALLPGAMTPEAAHE